jgi:hypothetical protein
MKFQVTVSLEFDVSVPTTANTKNEAEENIENMDLAELLEWSGCASYNINILTIEKKL